MQTFKLVYADDDHGPAKWIEFESLDAAGALEVAKAEVVDRWAELFVGEKFLCRLENTGAGGDNIWMVAGHPERNMSSTDAS